MKQEGEENKAVECEEDAMLRVRRKGALATLQCKGFQAGVTGEVSPLVGDAPSVSLRMGLCDFGTSKLDTTRKEYL